MELEQPSRPFLAQPLMGAVQSAIYFAVGTLLIVAAVFTCAGTVIDLVEGRDSRPIADAGLFVLDRVLLLFISPSCSTRCGSWTEAAGSLPSRSCSSV